MSYLSKTQVTVGSKGRHPFPMSPLHLTTGKFLHFDVAFAKELMPRTNNSKVNHKTFVRCMPIKKPILSAVSFHKSAYFVPFRTVWEPFTDFKQDTPHVQQEGAAILSNVPLLSNNTLVRWFISHSVQVTAQDKFDFNIQDGTVYYYRFNSYSRDVFKLLRSLGYSVYFSAFDKENTKDRTSSALPLLCASKVYLDYFFPNQYAHSGYYINLDGIFSRQFIYTLSTADLESIFRVCRFVSYDSDYFVSAFDSPLGPSAGVVSDDYVLRDLSSLSLGGESTDFSNGAVVQNSDWHNTPVVTQGGPLTQELDDKLKALTNYIRRHGLAGSRSLERYLADYGVALSADKLKRCYKLGEKHFPLQVSDIVSSSDTIQEVAGEVTGAALGDFAGQGVAFNGDFSFDCDVDEFGYLFVIQTIVPEVAYFQGTDRNVLHKTRLDFFTSDFDGLSTRPITSEELFVGLNRASVDYDNIFGFTPTYSEYKLAPDRVSGDFLIPSLNVGLMGWSTVREFSDDIGDDSFDEVHGFNFIIGNDWEQYNRIFADSDDDSDKFVIVHRCNMKPFMPARPLYDFYDFDDGGEKITLDVNGVKSN